VRNLTECKYLLPNTRDLTQNHATKVFGNESNQFKSLK